VKPAPAEETVVIPKTLPVEAKMGPSPVKPAPKTTAVAEAPKLPAHKPATEHPSAATKPHEGSAKEEARKEEAKKEEAEKEAAETEARKPAAATAEQTYVVQPGDNLHKIAAKFYGDERKWRVILEANKTVIPAANKLNAGTKIKIPASAPEAAKPAEAAPTAKKSTPKEETTAVKPAAKEAGGPKKYTVKAGDTLTSIAEQEYGDEDMVDKILAANKDTIKDKDKLFVGQVLTIPPK
jgi:nucleoid-associated protein YgaU